MSSAVLSHIRTGAAQHGVVLNEDQVKRLGAYVALLLRWNERINLTAITEPAEVVEKHLLDSVAVAAALDRVGAPATARLLDAGTGAGFPGAVLALVRPNLRVTLLDSTQKKVAFLRTVGRELRLQMEYVCARMEAFAPAEPMDIAVSRAAWAPVEWLRLAAPQVRSGGLILAMVSQEPDPAPPAGFRAEAPYIYTVAGASRRILAYRRG